MTCPTLLLDPNMTLTCLRPPDFPTEIPALKCRLRLIRMGALVYGPSPSVPGPPGRLSLVVPTDMTLLASCMDSFLVTTCAVSRLTLVLAGSFSSVCVRFVDSSLDVIPPRMVVGRPSNCKAPVTRGWDPDIDPDSRVRARLKLLTTRRQVVVLLSGPSVM